MKKHVVIFEARGGSDKGPYGFRKDSKPIIDSLKKRGWTAEIIFYRDEDRAKSTDTPTKKQTLTSAALIQVIYMMKRVISKC